MKQARDEKKAATIEFLMRSSVGRFACVSVERKVKDFCCPIIVNKVDFVIILSGPSIKFYSINKESEVFSLLNSYRLFY